MANIVKINQIYLNLDRVLSIEDLFAGTKEDKVVVRFGPEECDSLTFKGRDADDLRTWLNSVATNLHEAIQRDSEA
jgi:hypothetical protein